MPKFSKYSLNNLKTCHEDIKTIMHEAIKYYDFMIVCGHRNKENQNIAFYDGHSQLEYPKSKHNKKPSLAIDCIPYPTRYNNKSEFYYMAGAIMTIAIQKNIKLKWGGHWKTFIDLPHFELRVSN